MAKGGKHRGQKMCEVCEKWPVHVDDGGPGLSAVLCLVCIYDL